MILEALHQSPIGGHSCQYGTYRRIQSIIYWPNTKVEVCKWESECDVCQRVKSKNIHPPGLLQPLPVPTQAWQDISLDFVEGLPNSGHKYIVMVVVDRLTKYGHFWHSNTHIQPKMWLNYFSKKSICYIDCQGLLSRTEMLFSPAISDNISSSFVH